MSSNIHVFIHPEQSPDSRSPVLQAASNLAAEASMNLYPGLLLPAQGAFRDNVMALVNKETKFLNCSFREKGKHSQYHILNIKCGQGFLYYQGLHGAWLSPCCPICSPHIGPCTDDATLDFQLQPICPRPMSLMGPPLLSQDSLCDLLRTGSFSVHSLPIFK